MIRWIEPPKLQAPASLADLRLHPLAEQALLRRGISDLASARAFLEPDSCASTPFPGIEPAVDLLRTAIRKGDPICVWGDFDVDGQTSTTLLVQTLQAIRADVIYYIPVRARESHGIHLSSLKPIIERGVKLLLTCDTGITAYEAVDYARACGLTVVVTDHHDLGEALPNANAIINPKTLPEGHPLASLAGVGVAYKLAEVLLEADGFGHQDSSSQTISCSTLLDLVALGLIADVALLTGETRSLAQRGIAALRYTDRTGLRVMAELSGTTLDTLTEETIGFTFAPRLNALGRLGDANPAVELLLRQDAIQARVLATQIEGLNAQRRLLTSQVYQAAEAQLRADPRLLEEPAIVLSHPGWPGGVVGIVASRLVERYYKPAILLTASDDGLLRGSARSVEGLHITEAIASQKDLLRGFGGHPMAAGLSLEAEKLAQFRRGLGRAIVSQLGASAREEPVLEIDGWLGLDEISLDLAESLERLAPFGAGNPVLTLATHGVKLKSAAEIGKTREHLRLVVEDDAGRTQQLLWWGGAGEELPEQGSRFDIAYSLRASSYRGTRQASVQFAAFRTLEAQGPLEVRFRVYEIVDCRAAVHPAGKLLELKEQHPGLLVWAEGSERAIGKPRHKLSPSRDLAIYTSPASAAVLHRVLEKVGPERVYLFAVPGSIDKLNEFLDRLAGLCKYAIKERGGRATIEELSGATSQREATVQHGLEWLRLGGHISFQGEEKLEIGPGNGQSDRELQSQFQLTAQALLQETIAYRKFYASTADTALVLNR